MKRIMRRAGFWPQAAVLAGGALLFFAVGTLSGLAAVEEEKFEAVEDATEEFKGGDDKGEEWTISQSSGRLERGGENFLNEAANLKINDVEFEAEEVLRASGSPRWRLTGTLDGIVVRRDIYFDAGRGGVRYLETFTNSGDEEVTVNIEYLSRFRHQWRKLYTADGRDFEGKLGVRDTGLYVQMSEEAQHQGGLFLLCGERGAHKPGIETRDRNTLSVRYTLSIPPKQSRSLAQWVALRRLTDPEKIKELTREFYRQRLLADARISREALDGIVNFDLDSEGVGEVEPHDERVLVALAELAGRLGVIRTGHDILWVSPDSQLNGELRGETIEAATRFGAVTVPVAEVVAIQGGGGRGRQVKLFLRDGSVLVVSDVKGGLKLAGSDGWELDLELEQIEYLFARIGKEDGRVPPTAKLFARFHSGDVCALVSAGAGKSDRPLMFMTAWGPIEVPASEVVSLTHLRMPSPRHRLALKDGTRLTAFLTGGALQLDLLRFGAVDMPAGEVSGLWTAAGDRIEIPREVEAIDEARDLEGPACLLTGSNLISGKLAEATLHVVTGTTVTPVKTGEILAIARSFENESDVMPVFEIELKRGDILSGTLRDESVAVESRFVQWSIPVPQFVGMQAATEGEEKK